MPQMSLTDLVEIVSAAGVKKAKAVAAIKSRPAYSPAIDFYRRLREEISTAHQTGMGRDAVKALPSKLTDPKKIGQYSQVADAYAAWWGKRDLKWFEPSRGQYSRHGFDVRVNPELGLEIGGVPHLVKLYFKADKLEPLRVDLATVLMELTLRQTAPAGTVMAILDIRRAKLIPRQVGVDQVQAMVDAELAYVANLWDHL